MKAKGWACNMRNPLHLFYGVTHVVIVEAETACMSKVGGRGSALRTSSLLHSQHGPIWCIQYVLHLHRCQVSRNVRDSPGSGAPVPCPARNLLFI